MKEVLPKKSLGQHWLNDPASLQSICDAAHIQVSDEVLEIGPGMGSLTRKLLERGAHVFAVEFDAESVGYLERMFERQPEVNLRVEQGDIRSFDLRRMIPGYKIVANIPYYLTSHLIQIISESVNPPSMAVLLIQKEVAERVCANPGKMSLLSVSAQFYWETSLGMEIAARLFTPPPKVDSQVLILKRRPKLLFDVDEKLFFRLVKSGFASKRKTLMNSLSGGLRIGKPETLELLNAAVIDSSMRPQELSMKQWFDLYQSATSLKLLS